MSTSPAQMSEARRYQQLRAHLSYLKLDAAAEALPRILDQARADQMSLTTAMERLLEIEVSATDARKLASRLRFACLPEPWTLSDFDFSAQPGVDEKLIRDLATLRFLAVLAAIEKAAHPAPVLPHDPDQAPPADCGTIALTVPEAQRLFHLFSILTRGVPSCTCAQIPLHLRWSDWRRRHQARARWHHYRTRLALIA